MPKINVKAKGASGEREFCSWLAGSFGLSGIEVPERNLEQTRSGGADIIYPPFAFEIKRCEALAYGKWWAQVNMAVKENGTAFGLEPIVAFRQNSKDWEFLISAKHINSQHPHGFIHVNEMVFSKWIHQFVAKWKYEMMLNNSHKQLTEKGQKQLDTWVN